MSAQTSQIVEFYKNQTVFLTGGSGFVGKVLIEKLLRECEEIRKIYVLMRPKKNKSTEERFQQLFNYPCFDVLKSKNANALEKVSLVNGNCEEPNLGLSEEDRRMLIEETSCFIHAAANVKFEQTLREASRNVRATQDAVDLAKEMKKLRCFVFISTAYSNCIYSHVKEEFYTPPLKAQDLFTIVNAFDDDTLQEITPGLLGKWPNTYVYAKCISEDIINSASQDLPITVVRPAIITSSVAEPVPGWIDNFYGLVGIVSAAGLGLLRSLHVKKDATANVVPVDYVANVVLAAAWKRGNSSTTTIHTFNGHKKNRVTWKEVMDTVEPECWKIPTEKVVWYYCFELRENKLWHQICVFFLHTVVSYIADFGLFCVGRPRIAVKGYQRLNKMLDLLSYFSTRNWDFDDNNTMRLWEEMTEEDRKKFWFNMEHLDRKEYAYNSVVGARMYLLKDTPDTLPQGRRKLKILFVVHYTVLALFWYLVYRFVMFVLGWFF